MRHILIVGSREGETDKVERFLKNELSFQSRLHRADTFKKALACLQKHVFDLAVVEDPLPDSEHEALFRHLEEIVPDLPLLVLAEKKPAGSMHGRKVVLTKKELKAETFIPEVLKVWNRQSEEKQGK